MQTWWGRGESDEIVGLAGKGGEGGCGEWGGGLSLTEADRVGILMRCGSLQTSPQPHVNTHSYTHIHTRTHAH